MHDSRLTPAATRAGPHAEQRQAHYPCFDAANAAVNLHMTNNSGSDATTMPAASDMSSDLSDAPLTPSAVDALLDTPEMMDTDNLNSINGAQHLTAGNAQLESAAKQQIPQHDGASDSAPPAKSKRRAISVSNASTKKRAKKDDWSAEHVLQNESSALAFCDLKSILAHPDAFSSLSPEQQEHLFSMLPNHDAIVIGKDGRRVIDPIFLKSDIDWRHGVSRLQEDIAEGRYDPEWLRQAITAFEQRKSGAFDSYKDQEFEEFWGIKQKLPHNVIAGLTSSVKWENLFISKILQVGDVLIHKRNHRQGKTMITVEKEAKIIEDGSDARIKGYPTISIPPGEHTMSNPDLREDVVLHHVAGPEHLVRAITQEDGRLQNIANGNGWKSIRVFRKNQDLGSLWDIRQAYHFSLNEGDYQSILSHVREQRHRATRAQQEHGFYWVNPLQVVVKKILISDLLKQHPNEVLPICEDLARSLANIAQPGYTFVKCDPRLFQDDGIPFPHSDTLSFAESLERVVDLGPAAYPTAYTREIAGRNGWSGGHAHIGALTLNFSLRSKCSPLHPKTLFVDGCLDCPVFYKKRRNVNAPLDPNLLLTSEEKYGLKCLFESDKRFTSQNERDLLAHLGAEFTKGFRMAGNHSKDHPKSTFSSSIGSVPDHSKDRPKSTSSFSIWNLPGAPNDHQRATFSYGIGDGLDTPNHDPSSAFSCRNESVQTATQPIQDGGFPQTQPEQIIATSNEILHDDELSPSTDMERHAEYKFNPPQFHAERFDATELSGQEYLRKIFNMRNTCFVSDYPAASTSSGPILSRETSTTPDTPSHSSPPAGLETHECYLLEDQYGFPQIHASLSYKAEFSEQHIVAFP